MSRAPSQAGVKVPPNYVYPHPDMCTLAGFRAGFRELRPFSACGLQGTPGPTGNCRNDDSDRNANDRRKRMSGSRRRRRSWSCDSAVVVVVVVVVEVVVAVVVAVAVAAEAEEASAAAVVKVLFERCEMHAMSSSKPCERCGSGRRVLLAFSSH